MRTRRPLSRERFLLTPLPAQDIHPNNVVQADPEEQYAATIESGRMFIIDFGISRFMAPGVPLPADRVAHMQGHYDPPEGRDKAEPYSYDVYCVGAAIRTVCWVCPGDACHVPC